MKASISIQPAASLNHSHCRICCRFGQLQAVNTAGVKPAIHAVESGNRLRPDTAAVFGARGELMAAAPAMQDVYVKASGTCKSSSACNMSHLAVLCRI